MLSPAVRYKTKNKPNRNQSHPKVKRYQGTAVIVSKAVPMRNELLIQSTRLNGMFANIALGYPPMIKESMMCGITENAIKKGGPYEAI